MGMPCNLWDCICWLTYYWCCIAAFMFVSMLHCWCCIFFLIFVPEHGLCAYEDFSYTFYKCIACAACFFIELSMLLDSPLQPWFDLSQSTSCYCDKDINLFVFIWLMLSTATSVENAQQLPVIGQVSSNEESSSVYISYMSRLFRISENNMEKPSCLVSRTV